MKFYSSAGWRVLKLVFFGLASLFLLVLGNTILRGIVMGELEWPCLLAIVPFALMALSAKYQTAPGELTPEGVYVRHFFLRRLYPWSHIIQAGIIEPRGRNNYHEIILVKRGGSPRVPGDLTGLFFWRNLFRLIHIPLDRETAEYVIAHYGPLDYDKSNGNWDD